MALLFLSAGAGAKLQEKIVGRQPSLGRRPLRKAQSHPDLAAVPGGA